MRAAALALLATATLGQGAEWPSYGHDPGGLRYSPLRKIHRGNVKQLTRAWTYHTGEDRQPFQTTPIVVDGVMYFTTAASRVIALDPDTGRELWKFDPQVKSRGPHRGVAYWRRGNDRRILYGTLDARLVALDAATGQPCAGFGRDGFVDLAEGFVAPEQKRDFGVTSPPAIYKDLVIVGHRAQESPALGPPGDVRAFDVRTGKLAWRFHTVPRPGEYGHDTWEGESWRNRAGVNAWSLMSVDLARGMVYAPLGSPAYDFYGGDRRGANLFANSLVALEAATGKRVWHFQMVHHDIWDYDLPAQPNLVKWRRREAVAQVTKMGFVYVLDRRTGSPVFPVEERPSPASDIAEESPWPTQPVPTKPPPLARITMSRHDLSRVTPEHHEYCSALYDTLTGGAIFTPFGSNLTLHFPGTLGGATWSGAAFDPATGLLYVNINETGAVGRLERVNNWELPYRRTSPEGEYARFWDQNRWPCQQPPWGTLNAVDLNTGAVRWRVPLGEIDELTARGVPKTGTMSLGGAIVTAGGLVFIAGTNDRRIRAFDATSGRELWAARLEASGYATPMTYRGRSGKQFVVIAVGGMNRPSGPDDHADVLAAYALP